MKDINYKPSYDFKHPDDNQEILEKLYVYGNDIPTRLFHRMRINKIYNLINELKNTKAFGSNKKALDIGCNCGYLSKLIAESGFSNVLGVDLSDDFINTANGYWQQEGLVFKVQDATKLDINDKFGFILCTEVIEHTDKPKEVIESIYNLLSDDGVAIISLPNKISLNFLITILGKKLLGRPFSEDFRQHISYPFYKTINYFKSAGFKIEKTQGVNVLFHENVVPYVYKSRTLLRLDTFLSGLFPLKYFSQFFFLVIRKGNNKQ